MIEEIKYCECGCGKPAPIADRNVKRNGWVKGQAKRFIRGHGSIALFKSPRYVEKMQAVLTGAPSKLRGRKQPLEHRAKKIRSLTGKEPIMSPFISAFISLQKGRWIAGGKKLHARAVWEHFNGPVPAGFHVHHKNGDPSKIESDNIDNLMLLTAEWNLRFMPQLAAGFGIHESDVTKAYIEVEHIPYKDRFPAVCRILLDQQVDYGK
jgi:hypothetical protein